MRRTATLVLASLLAAVPVCAAQGRRAVAEEKAEHPRIAKAIRELEDAIAYMEAAPHDFGGHKAEAIQASERAIEQLRLAMQFRAKQDNKRGR